MASGRGKRTHEEVTKAFGQRCPHSCRTCLSDCGFPSGHSHRFDCCGVVEAHAMQDPPKGELYIGVISDPMAHGYCTGPSRTEAPA